MTATPQNLKPLTALRFFAAVWVIGFHYWPSLTAAAMPNWQAKGYLGVELFFVLSGFILSHVYLEAAGERRLDYKGFLWARLARVYPLHIATLLGLGVLGVAASLAHVGTVGKLLVWKSLPAQLLMLQAWGLAPGGGWNHPSWSISAEWFAYLSFPAFAFVAWRLRDRPKLAVALAAALVIALDGAFQAMAGFPLTRATLEWGALRIVPCFALGCATFLLWRAQPLRRAAVAMAASIGAVLATVLAAVLGAPDVLLVLLFGAVIYSLGSLSASGSKRLTAPVWVWLGEVSFALYMVCIPWSLIVINAARVMTHSHADVLPLPYAIALVAGVLPLAALAHHLIELPSRRAMRRMSGWSPIGRIGRIAPAAAAQ